MKRGVKIGLIIAAAVIVAGIGSVTGYLLILVPGVIDSYEVNDSSLNTHVLIAAQETEFKNAVVDRIVKNLKDRPVHIGVIDVTDLSGVRDNEWDAVVLLSSMQAGKLQSDTDTFLKTAAGTEKFIVVVTSGEGNWKPADIYIDTVSSTSDTGEITDLSLHIIQRIDSILNESS